VEVFEAYSQTHENISGRRNVALVQTSFCTESKNKKEQSPRKTLLILSLRKQDTLTSDFEGNIRRPRLQNPRTSTIWLFQDPGFLAAGGARLALVPHEIRWGWGKNYIILNSAHKRWSLHYISQISSVSWGFFFRIISVCSLTNIFLANLQKGAR